MDQQCFSTFVATGLIAGTYTATITDANGCTSASTNTISQPAELSAAILNVTNVSCFNACDGDATASATGGISPYFYQWNAGGNFLQSATVQNLCANNLVEVTVTDNSGCQTVNSVSITEPPALTQPTPHPNRTVDLLMVPCK